MFLLYNITPAIPKHIQVTDMKTAVVLFSFALVFLALLEVSSAIPGEVEIKGKQSKSSSDIESCSSDEKNEAVKVGGVSYQQGSKKNEYSQDYDSASASEKEENVNDGCGNTHSVKFKSTKTSSVDVDGESSSTYKKVSY